MTVGFIWLGCWLFSRTVLHTPVGDIPGSEVPLSELGVVAACRIRVILANQSPSNIWPMAV